MSTWLLIVIVAVLVVVIVTLLCRPWARLIEIDAQREDRNEEEYW
jgi:hypothetical protein